jgi:hypothetical protein
MGLPVYYMRNGNSICTIDHTIVSNIILEILGYSVFQGPLVKSGLSSHVVVSLVGQDHSFLRHYLSTEPKFYLMFQSYKCKCYISD